MYQNMPEIESSCNSEPEEETATQTTFFDYLKSRHVVVRGGAAPPAPPRRCAGPWPLPRHLFHLQNIRSPI